MKKFISIIIVSSFLMVTCVWAEKKEVTSMTEEQFKKELRKCEKRSSISAIGFMLIIQSFSKSSPINFQYAVAPGILLLIAPVFTMQEKYDELRKVSKKQGYSMRRDNINTVKNRSFISGNSSFDYGSLVNNTFIKLGLNDDEYFPSVIDYVFDYGISDSWLIGTDLGIYSVLANNELNSYEYKIVSYPVHLRMTHLIFDRLLSYGFKVGYYPVEFTENTLTTINKWTGEGLGGEVFIKLGWKDSDANIFFKNTYFFMSIDVGFRYAYIGEVKNSNGQRLENQQNEAVLVDLSSGILRFNFNWMF